MNKREFLKVTGLFGITSMMPFGKSIAEATDSESNNCVLIPTEMAGPFPLDLSENSYYFRQDIRENKPGTHLNLKLKILGENNCGPLKNARVNIWHCDKDGNYSGYDNTMNPGQAGLTYLRGYQLTDANGEVNFVTSFPGWYSGRVCHIHFQVYVNSSYSVISQLTFDHAKVNALYASNSSVYTKGSDPLTPGADGIFRDGYNYQVATLEENLNGDYESYLEVTVKGSGVITGYIERENSNHFILGQNFPNPYVEATVLPFTLKQTSDVTISLFDLTGKKIATVLNKSLSEGEHEFTVHPKAYGITVGNYIYQIEVSNSSGWFVECKMMTAAK